MNYRCWNWSTVQRICSSHELGPSRLEMGFDWGLKSARIRKSWNWDEPRAVMEAKNAVRKVV